MKWVKARKPQLLLKELLTVDGFEGEGKGSLFFKDGVYIPGMAHDPGPL